MENTHDSIRRRKAGKYVKKLLSLIMAVVFVFAMVSCSPGPYDGESDFSQTDSGSSSALDVELSFDTIVGEALPLKSLDHSADQLVDDSGMSGLWAPNHLHAAFDGSTQSGSTYVRESMYVTETPQQPIYFDLGSVQAVGKLYIWNYADTSDLESGVKEVQISYSQDNTSYTNLGVFSISMADADDAAEHGGVIASNLIDSDKTIDFEGIPARYIVIVPLSNWGGSKYGLSEVRVFRHKTRPSDGELIFTEAFTPRMESDAENITNNSGMSAISADSQTNETADNNPGNMWYSDKSAAESMLIINLDGTYPLDSLKIWNYNDPSNLDSGINEVEIYYTTGEACNIVTSQTEQDYYNFESGKWSYLGRFTVSKGTGAEDMQASLALDLEGIHAQHIKIKPVSNYRGTDSGFGLSEVRLYSSTGWAVEPARLWSGVVSSSGSFKYQGNYSDDPFSSKDQGSGWIGGDGIFSTSLNGSQIQGSVNADSITLFTFQDSFTGNMGNYRVFEATSGYSLSPGFAVGMKNMGYMFLTGNLPDVRNVQFYTELNNGLSKQHEGENILPGKYWISDSTVIDGQVFTIANKFEGLAIISKDFFLQEIGDAGTVDMDQAADKLITGVDDDLPDGIDFEPIYEEDGYIYQYGRKNSGKLIVRRTTPEEYKSFSGWEYWDGNSWQDDPSKVVTISDRSVGNEFNVTYMETGAFAGKYIAVYIDGSIWGTVTCAVSDNITGPFKRLDSFSDTSSLYWATERYKMGMTTYSDSKNYYVQWNYNAKSQPAISAENELLITYHFGLHDDRVPPWGFFSAVGKEYEHPTFINLIEIK